MLALSTAKRSPVRPAILAIDDDESLLASLHLVLDDSFDVVDATDVLTALAVVAARHIDLILLDLVMEGLDGVAFLEQLRSAQHSIPVIVVSALRDPYVVATVMRLGAVDYIVKPFDDSELLAAIGSALASSGIRLGVSAAPSIRLALVNCGVALAASLAVLLSGVADIEILGTISELTSYLELFRPDLLVADISHGGDSERLIGVIDECCRSKSVVLLGDPAIAPSGAAAPRYTMLTPHVGLRTLLSGVAHVLPDHAASDLLPNLAPLRMRGSDGVILDFSRRGKPTDNAAIESFNGRFREECLNVHWFASLEEAQQKIDAFRWDYTRTILTELSRA